MKKIIRLYGGDAKNIFDLYVGDWMTIDLIDKAIGLLLKEAYLTNTRIKIDITEIQLRQIKSINECFGAIYFLPINVIFSKKKIQVCKLFCNEQQINIYTSRD